MALGTPVLGWSVLFMSLCVIGVHGMLSGTASMDFGGSKSAGVVTGVIDGFVYLGTGTQALLYGRILPQGDAIVRHGMERPPAEVGARQELRLGTRRAPDRLLAVATSE
jgi:OPA family glycerol-3-phosphate transporter-like MFS transporter